MAKWGVLPRCCGIHELGHIRDNRTAPEMLMAVPIQSLKAHVVFSVTDRETAEHRKGQLLANYIVKHKLGTVVETPPAANAGHAGTIKAWLWTPNHAALNSWQAAMRKRYPNKYKVQNTYDWWT